MKKSLIKFGALAILGLSLASCDKIEVELNNKIDSITEENEKIKADNEKLSKENEELKNEKEKASKENEELISDISKYENGEYFTIKYVDYLGKTSSKTYLVDDYDNVLDALKADNNVEVKESQYGSYINRINNSFVDNNWSIMIYENYDLASSGIDDLEINAGDVFEFKHECWNTISSGYGQFDEYDILVDKVIYNFIENRLSDTLSNINDFKGSNYWEFMALNLLLNAKSYNEPLYDNKIINTNIINQSFVDTLKNADLNSLSTNDLFKYFYSARLFSDIDLNDLKSKYISYFETKNTYVNFDQYSVPFMASSGKTLGLSDKIALELKNPTFRPDFEWGADGYSWLLNGMASFNNVNDSDLASLSIDIAASSPYSCDVSLSSIFIPYSALNKNVRDLKDENGTDAIKYLFDNYFDETEMKFDTEKSNSDYSSNQIYSALIAYKVRRDTNEAQNLFE